MLEKEKASYHDVTEKKYLTGSELLDIISADKRKAPDKQLQLLSRASHASS